MSDQNPLVNERTRRFIFNTLATFGNRRFTLDQFGDAWYQLSGATSLDFCHRALKALEESGDVIKIDLMHWKSIAPPPSK